MKGWIKPIALSILSVILAAACSDDRRDGGLAGSGGQNTGGAGGSGGVGGVGGIGGESGVGGIGGESGVGGVPPGGQGGGVWPPNSCDHMNIGQQVPWPTQDWTIKTPEEMDMNSAVMEAAFEYAFRPEHNTQALIVIRGGALVAERFGPGANKDFIAASWSSAKSYASALIGIAIDEGLIANVNVPMTTFFPDWIGTGKDSITLQSVLWMQSGLDFNEDYSAAALLTSDVIAMGMTNDALNVAKGQPIKAPPNTRWYYSSGDTQLLDGVILAATGKNSATYGQEKIFSRIGMNPVKWWVDGTGHTLTFCCIDTPSRQSAKFGLLFLRNGNWDGQQIVSEGWVHESTTTTNLNPGYAYQWWPMPQNSPNKFPKDLYFANGLDDQRIVVIPSLDLVIVRHGKYEPPPDAGTAVADAGYLFKFGPRLQDHVNPLSAFGTYHARMWQDEMMIGPIINSVNCYEPKYDMSLVPNLVTISEDPVVCRESAKALGGNPPYCEELHGCVCDKCARSFMGCYAYEGCQGIIRCALEKQCRGIDCYAVCGTEVDASGGAYSASVNIALELSECVKACPLTCP